MSSVLPPDRSAAPCCSWRWPAEECRARGCGHGRVRLRFGGSVSALWLHSRSCSGAGWSSRVSRLRLAVCRARRFFGRIRSLACVHARPSIGRSPLHRLRIRRRLPLWRPRRRGARARDLQRSGRLGRAGREGPDVIAAALRMVSKRFGEAVALDRVDFAVEAERSSPSSARTAPGRRPHWRSCSASAVQTRAPRRSSSRPAAGAGPSCCWGDAAGVRVPADAASAGDRRARAGTFPLRRTDR